MMTLYLNALTPLSEKHFVRFQLFKNLLKFSVTILVVAFAFSACTGGRKGRPANSQTNPSGGPTGDFQISRVMRSPANPESMIDIVGDGSGVFANYCRAENSSTPSSGKGVSTCKCRYTYYRTYQTNSDGSTQNAEELEGGTEQKDVETEIYEANLIRCPYRDSTGATLNPIPTEAVQADIRIVVYPSKDSPETLISNSLTLQLVLPSEDIMGGAEEKPPGTDLSTPASSVMDKTKITSFNPALRFQCRPVITIANPLDRAGASQAEINTYDPFQSEHTRNSFPLNFYTNAVGTSMLALTLASVNDSEFSKYYCSWDTNNPEPWTSLKIYSKEALSSGDYLIYPTKSGSFDRSTFYLMKEPIPPFSLAVNAKLSPGAYTKTSKVGQAGAFPPLGYAIPANPQGECPSLREGVDYPEDWEMVKVWAWRASIPQIDYVKSSQQIATWGKISCDPGMYESKDPNRPGPQIAFPDCNGRGATTQTDFPIYAPSSYGLSSRLIFPSASTPKNSQTPCMQFQNPSGGSAGGSGTGGAADVWARIYGKDNKVTIPPWNLSSLLNRGGRATPVDTIRPSPSDIGQVSLESLEDFLFTVSPIDVSTDHIEESPYHPATVKTREDCDTNGNPNSDCPRFHNEYSVTWNRITKEIGVDDSSAASIYPFCAVRPKK